MRNGGPGLPHTAPELRGSPESAGEVGEMTPEHHRRTGLAGVGASGEETALTHCDLPARRDQTGAEVHEELFCAPVEDREHERLDVIEAAFAVGHDPDEDARPCEDPDLVLAPRGKADGETVGSPDDSKETTPSHTIRPPGSDLSPGRTTRHPISSKTALTTLLPNRATASGAVADGAAG